MTTYAQEIRRPASLPGNKRSDAGRAVQRAALRDSAGKGDRWDSDDSFEYVLVGLDLVKRKKNNLERRDAEQLCQLGLDLKPYFSDKTLAEWE